MTFRPFIICLYLLFIPSLSWSQRMIFRDIYKLPNPINTEFEESLPLLSPDGKTLYFCRILDPGNTGKAGSDVWTSQLDSKGQWMAPVNTMLKINSKGNDAVVGISQKGDVIYFLRTWPSKATKGIYFIKLIGNQWSSPELIHIPNIESDGFLGAYVSPDFEVIFLSMNEPNGMGEEDLYITTRDSLGAWSNPVNLGSTINTKGFEISPFLSPDKKRLYFSSNGHQGLGDADIYYSDRLYGSWEIWTIPKNLGDKVNSALFDAYFSIYGDSLGFFTSNRDGKLSDIYSFKSTPIDLPESDRKYLTEEETIELIGAAKMEIKFDGTLSTLNASQNELLFYIASKVLTKTELKLQLILNYSESEDLTKTRLAKVAEKLKLLGFGSYRLDLQPLKLSRTQSTENNIVKIILFK